MARPLSAWIWGKGGHGVQPLPYGRMAEWRRRRQRPVSRALAAQERRDGVQPHTYARLLEVGALRLAEGKRVPDVSSLMDTVRSWNPAVILCDRFRYSEVLDSSPPALVVARVSRWSSSSTEDINSLRRISADGPLAVAPGSRSLIGASLAVSQVKNDDSGNVRLTKSGQNTARDDVSAALILVCRRVGKAATY